MLKMCMDCYRFDILMVKKESWRSFNLLQIISAKPVTLVESSRPAMNRCSKWIRRNISSVYTHCAKEPQLFCCFRLRPVCLYSTYELSIYYKVLSCTIILQQVSNSGWHASYMFPFYWSEFGRNMQNSVQFIWF